MNKIVPKSPDVTLEDLKEVSDHNLNTSKDYLTHKFKWIIKGLSAERYDNNLSPSDLSSIILDPDRPEVSGLEEIDLEEVIKSSDHNFSYHEDEDEKLKTYIKALEEEKRKEIDKNLFFRKQKEELVRGAFGNAKILNVIDEGGYFVQSLIKAEVKTVLLITDTFFTRDTFLYKKIVDIFKANNISYVEFTNTQLDLSRKTIFRMAEFANDHDVNCIIPLGSSSTVSLSKILLLRLLKPSILNLHKPKYLKATPPPKYSIFSIPTFVTPDPQFNSKSAINNKLLFPNSPFFGNLLFLKNEVDDSDEVFYCIDSIDILNNEKLLQVLHETFFKLLFSYFDLSASDVLLESIITSIKTIDKFLEISLMGNRLGFDDQFTLLNIISTTMNGRTVIDNADFWILYKLEGALSFICSSKQSDGLALFFPTFIEVLSAHNIDFKNRAINLGSKLYGCYSVEGFVLSLISHIKKHSLPLSFLDIPEIRKVDHKLISSVVRRAMLGTYSPIFHKAFIKNLTTL